MIPYLIPDTFDMARLCDSSGIPLYSSDNLALYVLSNNPSVPTNNGIGVMGDAASCVVKSAVNAPDELTMTYPFTGSLSPEIRERCLIVAQPDRTRGPQPYRIYRVNKTIKGDFKIYARHMAHDGLSGIPVAPFSATDIQGAMAGLKSKAMVNCPYTFATTRTTSARFAVKVPTDIWSLMGGQQGSLLDVYGGEYSFDGYTVRLFNRIGQDNGVKVRYGVNMVDLEQDSNIANCYTGVVAYWESEDDEIHSPVVLAGGSYGYVRILPVDMSDRWETKPTVEQLKAAAAQYITANQIGVPRVSWKVKMVDLADTEEYKDIALLERVSLGDTVGVEFEELGVDASARVSSIEWDVLNERYKTITLGSVKANLARTIAGQAHELAQTPTRAETRSMAETISKNLSAVAMGRDGGSVRMLDTNEDGDPDEFYAADNKDPALAKYVTRINYRGMAVSDNGYNGPFKLGWTPEGGFMAWMITAAMLVAGIIQSADGETFYLNLDTGELRIGGYASKAELATSGGTVINGGNITTGTMSADRIYGGTLTVGGQNNQNGNIKVYNASGKQMGAINKDAISFFRLIDSVGRMVGPNSQLQDSVLYMAYGESTGTQRNMVTVGVNESSTPYGFIRLGSKSAIDTVKVDGQSGKIELNPRGTVIATITLDGSTGKITLNPGNTQDTVTIDGSTGRIDCKSLYINGVQVTP